jgi:hypothetical protein
MGELRLPFLFTMKRFLLILLLGWGAIRLADAAHNQNISDCNALNRVAPAACQMPR